MKNKDLSDKISLFTLIILVTGMILFAPIYLKDETSFSEQAGIIEDSNILIYYINHRYSDSNSKYLELRLRLYNNNKVFYLQENDMNFLTKIELKKIRDFLEEGDNVTILTDKEDIKSKAAKI